MKVGGTLVLKILSAFYVLQVSGFLRGPQIINMTTANKIMNPLFQSQSFSLDFFVTALFEEQSCTDLTVTGLGINKGMIRVADIFVRYSAAYEQLLLTGKEQATGYSLCLRDTSEPRRDTCAIPGNWKCDGFSTCLDDECGCGGDHFKCADGMGCITLQQVCDSRPDCLDFSDEIPCQDYQQCMRSLVPMVDTVIDDVPNTRNCNISSNLSKAPELLKLQTFFFGPNVTEERLSNHSTQFLGQISPTRLEDCRGNNTAFKFHCDRLVLMKTETAYKCTETASVEAIYKYRGINSQFTFVFCDGIKNCKNGIDEQNCPGVFYCKSDNQPVPLNRTCDSVSDCADSSDECNNCTMSSVLTSQTHLIGHTAILAILMAEILGILVLNMYGLLFHGRRFKDVNRSSLQIDIIQCITLTVYDTMMAVFLMIITWKHWEYRGEYCSHDVSWRSSSLCKVAGAIIYAASHGALQVAVAISICRNYQCRNILSRKRIKLSRFIPCFVLLNLLNLSMAVIPLIATFFTSSSWSGVFVHEYFFKSNPLIRRGNKSDIADMVNLYKGKNLTSTTDISISELFHRLRNMTTKGELFSSEKITSIGLYGTSSLCYPNLFSTEDSIFGFKVVYMLENSIYIIVIIICYVFIVQEYFESRRAVAPPVVAENVPGSLIKDGANPQNIEDQGFYLSLKVSIVIGSQLICWLPVHSAMIASFTGNPPPRIITDIFIANIAPLNAIMNPLLHTDLLSKLMKKGVPFVIEKWSGFRDSITRFKPCFNKVVRPEAQENFELGCVKTGGDSEG